MGACYSEYYSYAKYQYAKELVQYERDTKAFEVKKKGLVEGINPNLRD